ncbi:MAG: flavodoxin [bacterium]|nr:flavodoxin [bacterium]
MKKYLGVICVLPVLLFGLAGCASSDANGEKGLDSPPTQETGESGQQESSDVKAEESSAKEQDMEAASGTDGQPMETEGGKVLVAYFSATGTTKTLAEYAADALGADLYEIVPQEPYSSADLDYGDSNSRSSIEMDDPSARPAISCGVEDLEQYDILFLGYPIWWGEAPRIISTFMESYDFAGKTIVPFCTSGSSGIGSSAKNLHGLCADDVTWLDGKRFGGSASREDMADWIGGLGLDVEAK